MDLEKVIVQNGINTCYIDSLLMILFSKPSITEKILAKDMDDTNKIILQGLLMEQFVLKVRNGQLIDADTIGHIREVMKELGWKSEEDIYEQQDVSDFFEFLITLFDGELVKIKRLTFSESIGEESKSESKEESLPYITLNFTGDEKDNKTTVRELLNRWLYHNSCTIRRKILKEGEETEINVPALNQYSIVNSPSYLAFSINRFIGDEKIKTLVNISTHLRINIGETFYNIQGAICHKGKTTKMGHYYAFICDLDKQKFLLFDDQKEPSIEKISMDDIDRTKEIASEIVFLVYSKMPC